MHQHIDHIHNIFDGKIKGIPTLSIVGLLNDNYTGGEFIMWDNTVINLTKGSILIFPSTFMFPHRVNEIKSGVRHSFVSWTF
jgi:predicted 2-oxoglutarate/Fe(II)-dependent dioxygenase YbiX